MQFYFSLLLAFVKRMHAHVRRNLGFDSTFWGLGVLTSVVWQYTFHFESLHFQFFWTLRRFATACDWCRLQCGDWTKLHSETWLLPPLTPHHTAYPAVALLLQDNWPKRMQISVVTNIRIRIRIQIRIFGFGFVIFARRIIFGFRFVIESWPRNLDLFNIFISKIWPFH